MQGEQGEPQVAALGLMVFLIGALTLALWPAPSPARAAPQAESEQSSPADGRVSLGNFFQQR